MLWKQSKCFLDVWSSALSVLTAIKYICRDENALINLFKISKYKIYQNI